MMQGLTTVTLLHVAIFGATATEYQKAYNKAEKAGKPLLVLVGAEKAPETREVKEQVMPELNGHGGPNDVVFTEISPNAKPELTEKLLRGKSLPQLVLYTPVGKLWRRTHIAGAPSQGEIQKFLQREIAKGREVAARAISRTTQSNVISYSVGGS